MSNHLRLAVACGVSMWNFAAVAVAQQQTPAGVQSEVEEIIVTATRRSERLQDVPGQVSAIGSQQLEDLRANSLADFAAFTPGVSIQSTTPSTNRVAIRGITTGGSQLNSAIGLYLDDVPLGSSTPFGSGAFAPNVGLFDLERIEVLNGPQGTLFGANALGGVLRYITEAPSLDEFSGRVQGEAGYIENGAETGALRVMLNLPLVDNRVALRVDGVTQYDAGFIDDPDHNRENRGDARTGQGRASLLFKASPDLSVRFNVLGQRVKSNGLAVAFRDPVTREPVQGPYDQSFASNQPSEAELLLASAMVDWDLHWANLSSISAYQETEFHQRGDLAVAYSAVLSGVFGPAGVAPYIVPTNSKTERFTQEVRIASHDNQSFEWIVGGFYSHEDTFQDIGVVNAADPQGYLLGIPLGRFDLPSDAEEFALFADATVHFTPQLDATLGARYSWNDQTFTTGGSGLLVNPPAPFTFISSTGSSKQGVATYLFNMRYRPTDATMIYGRVANGYRPGGPNLVFGGVGTGNDSFDPDTLWNYEIGLRQGLGDDRGFLNISAYHIDWSDIQLVVNIGGVGQLVNGGEAEVDGVEASFSYRVLPDLGLMATAAYTDAKLTTTSPILGLSYEGARLPLSANYTFAAAAYYAFQATDTMSGNFNVSVRYTGERTSGFEGSPFAPLYRLDPYTTVDLTLSLRSNSGWEIGPYIKNVFDERGEVSASTASNVFVPSTPVLVTLSQPRTFGVVIGRSF